MTQLVLHHYASSPFSEKVRLVLGFKGLGWTGVTVPVIAPKPDVVALTGGYRKTPLLQIGADIYCDTALIARVVERIAPQPTLFPASAPMAPMLAQWADSTLFWTMIPYVMGQPAGLAALFGKAPPEAVKAFRADRAAFTAHMPRPTPADATAQFGTYLGWLDAQLADGRPFLLGNEPSIADFSVAHCLWYVRRAPPVAGILDPHARLNAWHQRVLSFGHGHGEKIDSAEAIRIAAAAREHRKSEVTPGQGFEPGEPVTVAATDYGTDPVAGTLVGLSTDEVVIERHDARAGTVHVHFPRIGFQIKKDTTA
ncbi:MAG: glutathione S-transferase family protein [Pseudomonadota bacterium]